jgi:hypothetical protein
MKMIEEMYAYVVTNQIEGFPEGIEGVIAVFGPMGWIPLVGADEEAMTGHLPHAQLVATKQNVEVRMLRFSTRQVIKTIMPETGQAPDPKTASS